MKNRRFMARLGFACSGVMAAFQSEKSFRTQLLMVLLTLPVMVWLNPAPLWWAVMIMIGALVLAAELFNTALESLIDHLHPEIHPSIKIAKDCAAGAVLILSIAGVLLSALLLWTHL